MCMLEAVTAVAEAKAARSAMATAVMSAAVDAAEMMEAMGLQKTLTISQWSARRSITLSSRACWPWTTSRRTPQ
eukprot:4475539-Pleurochrysis_carterae.AAC.1